MTRHLENEGRPGSLAVPEGPRSVRICVYGTSGSGPLRLDRLPTDAKMAFFGACITLPEAASAPRFADVDTQSPLAVLRLAAAHFSDEDLVLVPLSHPLPEYACERLLKALGESGVAAALPLDEKKTRRPLPFDQHTDLDADRLDALCFAYSDRSVIDGIQALDDLPALSAWHGKRIATLGVNNLGERDAYDAKGLRVVLVDHVYAGIGPLDTAVTNDSRDPEPPSPLEPLRQRLACALNASTSPSRPGIDGKPVILHVLHGWGGGAQRWVNDLAAADTSTHHLVLVARGSAQRQAHGEWLELRDGAFDGPALQRWPLPRPIADTTLGDAAYARVLGDVLRCYCIDAIVVSSLIGHSLDVLRTGLPTTCVVHDHYPLWPVLHRDFGDTALPFDETQRAADLASKGRLEFAERDPAHWKRLRDAFVVALVHARTTLIAPSHSALANHLRLAPELDTLTRHVIPHGIAAWPDGTSTIAGPPARKRLRLIVPGRIREGKGARLLTAALPKLREHAELFLLGAGSDAHDFFGLDDVHVQIDYKRDDLPKLLARLRPDAALLLPTVSETFSYTLSELRSLGVPIIATRIGALAERIKDGVDGFLVEPQADAIAARVATLSNDAEALARVRKAERECAGTLPVMAERYAATLNVIAGPRLRYALREASTPISLSAAATVDELERSTRKFHELQARMHITIRESERRGEWGHALDRELEAARKNLTQLHEELDQRAQWARSLDEQLDDARRSMISLHEALEERTHWAQALNHELDEMQHSLRAQIDERTQWALMLDRELDDARGAIAGLQHDLEERTQWARSLDREIIEQRMRIQTLETIARDRDDLLASRSWRATAPLRATTIRIRELRTRLRFSISRIVNAGRRTQLSLRQRGFAGTLRRIEQELRRQPRPGRDFTPAPILSAPPDTTTDTVADFAAFAVPGSDSPRVSIVIPVYNKVEYTLACLRSLGEHAGEVPFEVIVVDDGSSDATPERLANVAGIRALRNAQNLGFIGSCNAGAAIARGDYVLFLNNDTVVTAGWLDALVHCIETAPAAGLVGAKLVYPDGRLQEAGGIVFNDASGWNYGRFEDPADPRYSFRREVDYCSGAAILLRRDLFERLGRFDTRYAPAYYEDTDLAFAVRAAGLKVYVEPASVVVHFEGITSGTDTSSGTKRYQVVNREKFLDKWKDALARQPRPGTPIGIAATHRAGKRVLIVDATTPMPDHDSGSLRMVNLMRVLGDLGCQVSFMAENRLFIEGYTPALQALSVEVLYAPYAQDPIKILRERGNEFDLVILSRHYIAAPFFELVRLYAPQARLVFDTVDLHYLREQRAAELSGDAALARSAAATRAQELKLIRDSDVTLVVSPVEQELLARDAPGARVDVLSNVHEVHGCKRGFADRADLVFVGGFQHPPNVDAVEWFVHEAFDRIRAQIPELRLHVIGSRVPASIQALASEHVVVHGFVPDIMPFMDGCRVSVAPLRYGAGVKGKVNMAMSCGLPVVATPIAVEGMHVAVGDDVLVAEDAAAFADAVVRLYRDEALWQRLSAHGLANVERHFSFAAARAAVEKLFA